MKSLWKYKKNAINYFKAHTEFNALVHALGGIAVGILIASPLTFPHPLRWAAIFATLSIMGHLYAASAKK